MYKPHTAIALIMTALGANSALAATPTVSQKTIEMADIRALTLELHHGQVSLLPGAADTEQLVLELEQRLIKGSPERCLYEWQVEQQAERLQITAEPSRTWGSSSCSVERHYRVRLSASALQALELSHHHAQLDIEEIAVPAFTLETAHTQFRLGTVSSETAEISVRHGQAEIKQLQAKQFELNGQHSILTVSNAQAATARGEWQHGKLQLDASQIGELRLSSQHSAVQLKRHDGASLDAESAHGPLTVAAELSQSAQLQNAHGSIDFKGAVPRLRVENQHGHSHLVQTLASAPFEVSGQSRHGGIDLVLPKGSAYEYQLNAGGRRSVQREGATDNALSYVKLDVEHGSADVRTR